MNIARLCLLLCAVALVACNPAPLEQDGSIGPWPNPEGAAAQLSNDEYNSLTPEQQYQVANKLLGTLYKGVSPDEFFDLTWGMENPKVVGGRSLIAETANQLNRRLVKKDAYVNRIAARHNFSDDPRKATAEPLAEIWEFPISRDQFEAWMAYTLANTILFSPAQEIDSADYVDVHNVYNGLISALAKDASIRDIVYAHMISDANWRRFRSPEDNTREMIEIFLGLFDRDADVPKASIACQNWSITNGDGGYKKIVDIQNENTVPQQVLGQWVTTCEDFYRVIAGHPLLIPRITTVLVDHFFPKHPADKRAALVQSIVDTDPVRFHDIFAAIIFSREYLLNNEKPNSLEETFLNIAQRTHWKPDSDFFSDITNSSLNADGTLLKMNQPAMSLKLGRWKDQPLDTLSFAHYHKAVREGLLVSNNRSGSRDAAFVDAADFLGTQDFIDYVFLSVTGRKATEEELTQLKAIFGAENANDDKKKQVAIMMDYLSRLPEIYFQNAVK